MIYYFESCTADTILYISLVSNYEKVEPNAGYTCSGDPLTSHKNNLFLCDVNVET